MVETTLTPLPPLSRAILRVRDAGKVAGITLPLEACRAVPSGDGHALWLGPDEFLLLAAAPVGDAAFAGTPHALIDISDRQVAFALAGPRAADVLNAGCPLDLDLAAFPVGMCTRTVFARVEIVLWRREAELFHIEIWRSFAAYLRQLVEQVIAEYGIAA